MIQPEVADAISCCEPLSSGCTRSSSASRTSAGRWTSSTTSQSFRARNDRACLLHVPVIHPVIMHAGCISSNGEGQGFRFRHQQTGFVSQQDVPTASACADLTILLRLSPGPVGLREPGGGGSRIQVLLSPMTRVLAHNDCSGHETIPAWVIWTWTW